jgi:hypothetical protein
MTIRFLLALLLAGNLVFFSGCATTGDDDRRQSSIPWNRPQKWETGATGIPGVAGFGSR